MISILLATYNGEKYIRQSIDSVMSQTFTDWTLLVGFNGTTDSSKDIVASYGDNRIVTYDYGDDKGKAKTLNKLLANSRDPWCAIQDDDDIWHPQKLEKQMAIADSFDVVGTQIRYINEENQVIGGPFLATDNARIKQLSLGGTNQVANSSAIFRRSYAKLIGGWDETLDGIEDFDFWLKIMRVTESKFFNFADVLCFHRLHQQSNFNTNSYDVSSIL